MSEMNVRQVRVRMAQCVSLSKLSRCSRRQFGAIAVDPERNQVLVDGYNGPPRGSDGTLCGGPYCVRDGAKFEWHIGQTGAKAKGLEIFVPRNGQTDHELCATLERQYPRAGVESGTSPDVGCMHAERNAIYNAAARGVALTGAWLFVQGEPCLGCAEAIYHSGIKVVVVRGNGYSTDDGVKFLEKYGVRVRYAPVENMISIWFAKGQQNHFVSALNAAMRAASNVLFGGNLIWECSTVRLCNPKAPAVLGVTLDPALEARTNPNFRPDAWEQMYDQETFAFAERTDGEFGIQRVADSLAKSIVNHFITRCGGVL